MGGATKDSEDTYFDYVGDNYEIFLAITCAVACGCFVKYLIDGYRGRECPWQVTYIAAMEVCVYMAEICAHDNPAFLVELADGTIVYWVRYAGWLMTTPIILIHLSALPEEDESHLTKGLLVMVTSNQAQLVFGITACFAQDGLKIFMIFLSSAAALVLYVAAFDLYKQALTIYPVEAKLKLEIMCFLFFTTWTLFPVFFALGPEGFGQITLSTSVVLHAVNDLFAKNLWGYLAYDIRSGVLHDVASKMGITSAQYISYRRNANRAVKHHFEQWQAQSILGNAAQMELNLVLNTPSTKPSGGQNKKAKEQMSKREKSVQDDHVQTMPTTSHADENKLHVWVPSYTSEQRRSRAASFDAFSSLSKKLSKNETEEAPLFNIGASLNLKPNSPRVAEGDSAQGEDEVGEQGSSSSTKGSKPKLEDSHKEPGCKGRKEAASTLDVRVAAPASRELEKNMVTDLPLSIVVQDENEVPRESACLTSDWVLYTQDTEVWQGRDEYVNPPKPLTPVKEMDDSRPVPSAFTSKGAGTSSRGPSRGPSQGSSRKGSIDEGTVAILGFETHAIVENEHAI